MISDTKDWGTTQQTHIGGILKLTVMPIQWNFPIIIFQIIIAA